MAEDWNGREYTRVNTWKRIAAYLGEDVEAVQGWARESGLPVHRWPDGERGGVFAYTGDLDRWMRDALVMADSGRLTAVHGALLLDRGGLNGDPAVEKDAGDEAIVALPGGSLIDRAYERGARTEKVGSSASFREGIADGAPGSAARIGAPPPKAVIGPVHRGKAVRGFLVCAAGVFVAVLTAALLHSFEGLSWEDLHARPLTGLLGKPASAGRLVAFEPQRVPFGSWSETTSSAPPRVMQHRLDPIAVDLYLQGRYSWSLRTEGSLQLAKQQFTDAIRRDPEYAQAYAGLADCYLLLRQYGRMPSSEAFPQAESAARRAVALDDGSAEAHRSMAFVLSYWSWDMAAAEREFRRSLDLSPNDPETHHWYATSLMNRGRFEEALAQIELARALDPGSSAIVANRGLILLLSGEHDTGTAVLETLEASNPGFSMPHIYLADEDLRRGEDAGFLAEEETVSRLKGDRKLQGEMLAARRSFRQGGHVAMVRTLAQSSAASADVGGDAYRAALYCMLSQDRQATLRYLKISYDRHEPNFLSIDEDNEFAPLRGDPEFRALLALADVHA